MKELIWVNEKDEVVGYGEKIYTHQIEQLHRAFSLFVVDEEGRMLIQRRAKGKYHSGGLLSNACCSHPYKDEPWHCSLERCIQDELGAQIQFNDFMIQEGQIDQNLFFNGKFIYLSKYSDLSEHEYDHVFLYHCNQSFKDNIILNKDEIEEIFWMSKDELENKLKEPGNFTTWFPLAYRYIQANW